MSRERWTVTRKLRPWSEMHEAALDRAKANHAATVDEITRRVAAGIVRTAGARGASAPILHGLEPQGDA